MSEHAIEIRGLRKNFPQFSLGPLEMTVPRGSIYGFIGPNGSGKTTTIDLILGMGEELDGRVEVLGLDHREHEVAVKQQIGYVSPELNFQAWGKVGRAIQFTRGFYPTWDQEYCEKLLKDLNLAVTQTIATLSFGSRIKLALVLALAHRPALLILDEPTVGLDAISKQQIFSELLAAVEGGERTVLISSHGLVDVERFADSVGMIKNGRMIFEGTTAEVVDRFRMVDFIDSSAVQWERTPGFCVVGRDENRKRVLVDLKEGGLDSIKAHGAREVSVSPVTLEEVFVALGREGR
jgi:ABC-2 type transport system ATP-binding protein